MRRLLFLALAFLLASSMTAFAQGKGNAQGKGKGQGKGKSQDTQVTVVFDDTKRGAVRSYFVDTYGRGNCPPGLAKKNNGCLPPGQAKKRYVVGQRLPNGVAVAALPADLALRIGAAPDGYR